MTARRLDAAALTERGGPGRPARIGIVHLGLGNFHRAHQAWYTAHAADASQWGIAAFTGRSPRKAEQLRGQDGLYCLVTRGHDHDEVEVVPSIVEVDDASRLDRLTALLADSRVAVVTLTVTEAGYRLTADGDPDVSDPATNADLDELTRMVDGDPLGDGALVGVLPRLLAGLQARRRAGCAGIAIVPCDNIPANGDFVRRGLTGLASAVSAPLAEWIGDHVSFVSTSVDRITPRIDGQVDAVRDAGWIDASPVVTEPFSDWVLSGEFPAGRPAWETAGARFVDDIEPWENRKLWLLNGAHSILAFAGLPRGATTVAEAIADPVCRGLVTDFWSEAVTHLPDSIDHERYREELVERFANPRIEHRLTQIATDAITKVRYRFAAVAERTLAAGGDASASAGAIAAWIDFVLAGEPSADGDSTRIAAAVASDDPVTALLGLVSARLAADERFVDATRARLRTTHPIDRRTPRTG